jgi:secreted trypsin-like serine protease
MTTGYYVRDSSNNAAGFNLQTTANPAQGKGGTCSGDSGGPVFIAGTHIMVSVTSFGMNAECKGLDFSYRLDRQEVLDWITDANRVDAG